MAAGGGNCVPSDIMQNTQSAGNTRFENRMPRTFPGRFCHCIRDSRATSSFVQNPAKRIIRLPRRTEHGMADGFPKRPHRPADPRQRPAVAAQPPQRAAHSHFLRRKIRKQMPHTTTLRAITIGYPNAQPYSGMEKFMPYQPTISDNGKKIAVMTVNVRMS